MAAAGVHLPSLGGLRVASVISVSRIQVFGWRCEYTAAVHPLRSLTITLALAGCASAPPPEAAPKPDRASTPATGDGIPVISMRGTGARPRGPQRQVPVLRREEWPDAEVGDPPWARDLQADVAASAPAEVEPPPPAAAEDAGQTLPVVVGDLKQFDVLVQARGRDGSVRVTADVQDRAGHAWRSVDLQLELLAGRRPVRTETLRVGDVEGRRLTKGALEGVALDGADRVRVSVVSAEPMPGEREVHVRAGHLRGLEVTGARLLRSRDHTLDAILDLDGEPNGPWREVTIEVVFLDARGEAITRGTARLRRHDGPPWTRRHVVGAVPAPTQQVAEVEVRCTGVW